MENERGLIRNSEYYKQECNYTDFMYNKITPSDIDFMIEYKNRLFIIGEIKYNYAEMSFGQSLALERLVDNLKKPSLLFVATWTKKDCDDEERIILSACKVVKYRYKKEWKETTLLVKELCDKFIERYYK